MLSNGNKNENINTIITKRHLVSAGVKKSYTVFGIPYNSSEQP